MAVLGDMGIMGPNGLSDVHGDKLVDSRYILHPGQSNTMQSLLQEVGTYDAVIHAGDLAYADYVIKQALAGYFGDELKLINNTEIEDIFEQGMEQFYDQLTLVTASRPYMVAPGNHDSNCDNGGGYTFSNTTYNYTYTVDNCALGQTNFTGYRNHWRMPGHVTEANENMWYSYDDGMVHYVFFSTETDYPSGQQAKEADGPTGKYKSGEFGYTNQQIDWLKADLAAVDRSLTPWVLAVGHRPWYISQEGGNCTACQTAFEDVLVEGNVDIVFQGHIHAYQRTKPIAHGIVDSNGLNNPSSPLYIVNGAGGHWEGLDTLDDPFYYSEKQFDDSTGWSRFKWENATHVKIEFVGSTNGTILDDVYLYREH